MTLQHVPENQFFIISSLVAATLVLSLALILAVPLY